MHLSAKRAGVLLLAFSAFFASPALAQTAPSPEEIAAYRGLHAAAAKGDGAELLRLAKGGANLNARDGHGRTPLMVAAYGGHHAAARALIESGADLNARDQARYNVITIAAAANDLKMLQLAIAAGANTGLITSPYDGTALIAAAHLGHAEIVRALTKGKAPLNHVNNLGWTALIESIVLGDGGPRHVATLRALVKGGGEREPDRCAGRPAPHPRAAKRLQRDGPNTGESRGKAVGVATACLLSCGVCS